MDTTKNIAIPPVALMGTVPMTSLRRSSMAAGALYLLTFISIPTLALYKTIHGPAYVMGPGPDTSVIIGVILEIIVALAGIGTAVILYPILKRHNEGMSLGLVASRILEAGTIFAGAALLLTVVSLRLAGVGTNALVIGQTLVILYDRIFLIGQSFMPGINDLLLGLLLYQSGLVPRGLALVGLIGGPLLLSIDAAVLFGIIDQHALSTSLAAIPVALFEFSLGVWLVVKGFKSSQ